MTKDSADKPVVAVIGTNGLPANYGGWETLVEHLTQNLQRDVEFTVYCSSHSYQEKLPSHNGAKLVYVPLKANGVSSIFYDVLTMIHALIFAEVLLVLGVSGCIFLPVLKLFSKKKIIVNIDGIEWRRGKWSGFAKWFLKFSEKVAVKYADQVVSDNLEISNYVARSYRRDSTVIAYGVDHVSKEIVDEEDKSTYSFLNGKYAFTVCRIEPENNIHILLEAFDEGCPFPIVMVGNWDNSEYGRELKSRYAGRPEYYLLDPIYEQVALDKLRSNAHIYLHGHSVGGTNPSLVEAMSLSLPVIAYDVSYNRATTHNKALFFKDLSGLKNTISNLDDELLEKISVELKEISDECYRWSVVSDAYLQLFKDR